MTKREFNAAVTAGCFAGFFITCVTWGAALGLAKVERFAPGAGWALAGVAMLALYAFLRRGMRAIGKSGNREGA